MEKTLKLFTWAFAFLAFAAQARSSANITSETSQQYEKKFKKVLESHGRLISEVVYFSDHVGDLDKNPNHILVKKGDLEDKIGAEIARLKGLSDNSDKELVDSVVMYYDTLRKSIASEYDVAINLRMNMDYSHEHVHSFLSFLDAADQNIMKAEDFLYHVELRYAKKYEFKIPQEELEIRKKVLKNDAVIKYHNKIFLEFYKIYTIENEFLKKLAVKKDSSLLEDRKYFATQLFLAEEVVSKLISFDGDASLSSTIRTYFHYLRSENFKNKDFFNEYVKSVEKKHGKDHADQRHEQLLKNAQSKLTAPTTQKKQEEDFVKGLTVREQLLEKVEDASFRFLYDHCPSFK